MKDECREITREELLTAHQRFGFDTPEAFALWLDAGPDRDRAALVVLCNRVAELEKMVKELHHFTTYGPPPIG